MSSLSYYPKKANACADATKRARDPAERVALLQVSHISSCLRITWQTVKSMVPRIETGSSARVT
jgi:hypothetical protein